MNREEYNERVRLIEDARKKFVTFDIAIQEYLAFGNSWNMAYTYFTDKDIEKHKESSIKLKEQRDWDIATGKARNSSPVALSQTIQKELDKIEEDTNKNSLSAKPVKAVAKETIKKNDNSTGKLSGN